MRQIEQQGPEHLGNSTIYRLSEGNKVLSLRFIDAVGSVTSYIVNDPSRRGKPGATTGIYTCVRDLIITYISTQGKSFTYLFKTSNPKMRAWAMTRGREIFEWDELTQEGENLRAVKKFHPVD